MHSLWVSENFFCQNSVVHPKFPPDKGPPPPPLRLITGIWVLDSFGLDIKSWKLKTWKHAHALASMSKFNVMSKVTDIRNGSHTHPLLERQRHHWNNSDYVWNILIWGWGLLATTPLLGWCFDRNLFTDSTYIFTACDNEEQTAEEFFQKVRQCHTLTLYFRLIYALSILAIFLFVQDIEGRMLW